MGIFLILADLFRIPYFKTSKAFQNLIKRQRKKTSTIELWLQDLAQFIGKLLKLNEYTSNKFDARIQLISDLQTAGMEISPELHIAGAIIKAGICGLLAIPAFFIFPLITPVIIALAFAMYFKEAKGIQSRIKKRREAIEYELPRFVFFIAKTLVHSRDVLSLLDNYRSNLGLDLKTAGAVFKYELNITVADMRSGNYESALTRLESRVGSSMLSDVVRGLISILRGDNTAVYWQALSIKFSDIQRQLLKQQAQKVPGRVKRLSMILLFCFMAVYIVVIITEIMTSLGAMFG
jgi:hypothetical protein